MSNIAPKSRRLRRILKKSIEGGGGDMKLSDVLASAVDFVEEIYLELDILVVEIFSEFNSETLETEYDLFFKLRAADGELFTLAVSMSVSHQIESIEMGRLR